MHVVCVKMWICVLSILIIQGAHKGLLINTHYVCILTFQEVSLEEGMANL